MIKAMRQEWDEPRPVRRSYDGTWWMLTDCTHPAANCFAGWINDEKLLIIRDDDAPPDTGRTNDR